MKHYQDIQRRITKRALAEIEATKQASLVPDDEDMAAAHEAGQKAYDEAYMAWLDKECGFGYRGTINGCSGLDLGLGPGRGGGSNIKPEPVRTGILYG